MRIPAHPAPLLGLALCLASLPAGAAHDSQTIRLDLPSGSLEVQVTPERGRPLVFEETGRDRWIVRSDTGNLVGRRYGIELTNRTDERLKVVVAVDGVNVYWKEPLRGRADADVGSVLRPRDRRTLEGFQVDRHTAQRFVFSPPEWSEGAEVTDRAVGTIEVQVYREEEAGFWSRDREGRSRPHPQGDRPPLGTAAGEDFDNDVRPVRFDARTSLPEASALLVYGRPRGPIWDPPGHHGVQLGIRGDERRDGIRILEVYSGTHADDVGLRPGDVLTKVDSARSPSLAELRRILERKRPGDFLFLELERGPHRLTMQVKLDGRR